MNVEAVNKVGYARVPDPPEAVKARLGPTFDKASSMIRPIVEAFETAKPGVCPVSFDPKPVSGFGAE
jgi:hypothetical protein